MSKPRREQLLVWHREMVRLRAFEEAVARGHRDGQLPGLLHLAMGGEAVTTGLFNCLTETDRVYSAHRPHQHFVASGVDPRLVMAELAGRETGLCHGRAGTMHLMSDRVVMGTGIVGGTISLAVGHAVTQDDGDVVVALFGDGAVQTGTFHESMNLAALWKVPVLFLCENNGWAEFSSRDEHTTVGGVVRYGELYNIPAREVDGTDVEAVVEAIHAMLGPIREGQGPALLECHIARMRSHYEGDFREQTSDGDPLLTIEATLTEGLGVDAAQLEGVREDELARGIELLESVLAQEPEPDPADDRRFLYAAGDA